MSYRHNLYFKSGHIVVINEMPIIKGIKKTLSKNLFGKSLHLFILISFFDLGVRYLII